MIHRDLNLGSLLCVTCSVDQGLVSRPRVTSFTVLARLKMLLLLVGSGQAQVREKNLDEVQHEADLERFKGLAPVAQDAVEIDNRSTNVDQLVHTEVTVDQEVAEKSKQVFQEAEEAFPRLFLLVFNAIIFFFQLLSLLRSILIVKLDVLLPLGFLTELV